MSIIKTYLIYITCCGKVAVLKEQEQNCPWIALIRYWHLLSQQAYRSDRKKRRQNESLVPSVMWGDL